MIITIAVLLILFWVGLCAALYVLKRPLFLDTWREPYMHGVNVLIESDDWGPGGDFHTERFEDIMTLLSSHKDAVGRSATFTADMVMSAPDFQAMRKEGFAEYRRAYLDDAFPALTNAFQAWAKRGVLVPQFHGLEHCNGAGLCELLRARDARVLGYREDDADPWWDWEQLDSPLQGHYVDGTALPSQPVPLASQAPLVADGISRFVRIFGFPPTSAVAPCYLWNDDTEQHWAAHGVTSIQTAGYRCSGRDANGTYVQDKPWITFGSHSAFGQVYLVRNTMFEPTDGRGVDDALAQARRVVQQALPVVISTHRYNFTRSEAEHRDSLAQFERLLSGLRSLGDLRFASSPELGQWVKQPSDELCPPGGEQRWPALETLDAPGKFGAFLWRLWHRHEKLRKIAILSGLVLPGLLCVAFARQFR